MASQNTCIILYMPKMSHNLTSNITQGAMLYILDIKYQTRG